MNRSLKRHLTQVLASAVLIAGLLATAASFGLAYMEAKELQDDMLRQIGMLALAGTAQSDAVSVQYSGSSNAELSDPESKVMIFHLPGSPLPDWLKGDLSPGLHTLDSITGPMRVFVRGGQRRTLVVQPTEVRDEIAINSALRTLIPVLLLLPLLMWLITRIVRTQLEPVAQLASRLDEQSAARPQPVDAAGLPDEIRPFVHAINRLLDRVDQLIRQQRRFIADAAHELRSPLTALAVQADNLARASTLEQMRERVVPLQQGIARASQLTEQLLVLAGTQAGTHGAGLIDVPAMARELIAEYLPLAEDRQIDLGLDEASSICVSGERDVLRLILKNALENAIKYTPQGGEVTLRLLADGQDAVIEIVDNGPGIPVAERNRVIDPFYRMPGSEGGGSGLGLAIAYEAAMRLCGSLGLHEHQPDGGLLVRYRQAGNVKNEA